MAVGNYNGYQTQQQGYSKAPLLPAASANTNGLRTNLNGGGELNNNKNNPYATMPNYSNLALDYY